MFGEKKRKENDRLKRIERDIRFLQKQCRKVENEAVLYYLVTTEYSMGGRSNYNKQILLKDVIKLILDHLDIELGDAPVLEKSIRTALIKK